MKSPRFFGPGPTTALVVVVFCLSSLCCALSTATAHQQRQPQRRVQTQTQQEGSSSAASDCVDNDAMVQEFSGNPAASCERVARGGHCPSNCPQTSRICCVSCGPVCDNDGNGVPFSEQKKTPQLSRYCEILVSLPANDDGKGAKGNVTTDVMWHGGCDEKLWNQLRYYDASAPEEGEGGGPEALVRAERPEMLSMKLNGPRYMLIYGSRSCCSNNGGGGSGGDDDGGDDDNNSTATSATPSENNQAEEEAQAPVTMTVAGMDFTKIASLEEQVGVGPGEPYTPVSVSRHRNFTWCGGCETYQLADGNTGDRWIMQSFSQYVDPEMDASALRTLGDRLTNLPPNWTYAAVNLTSDFSYAAAIADVLNDDFENAYTKMHRPGCETCANPPQQPRPTHDASSRDDDKAEEGAPAPATTTEEPAAPGEEVEDPTEESAAPEGVSAEPAAPEDSKTHTADRSGATDVLHLPVIVPRLFFFSVSVFHWIII